MKKIRLCVSAAPAAVLAAAVMLSAAPPAAAVPLVLPGDDNWRPVSFRSVLEEPRVIARIDLDDEDDGDDDEPVAFRVRDEEDLGQPPDEAGEYQDLGEEKLESQLQTDFEDADGEYLPATAEKVQAEHNVGNRGVAAQVNTEDLLEDNSDVDSALSSTGEGETPLDLEEVPADEVRKEDEELSSPNLENPVGKQEEGLEENGGSLEEGLKNLEEPQDVNADKVQDEEKEALEAKAENENVDSEAGSADDKEATVDQVKAEEKDYAYGEGLLEYPSLAVEAGDYGNPDAVAELARGEGVGDLPYDALPGEPEAVVQGRKSGEEKEGSRELEKEAATALEERKSKEHGERRKKTSKSDEEKKKRDKDRPKNRARMKEKKSAEKVGSSKSDEKDSSRSSNGLPDKVEIKKTSSSHRKSRKRKESLLEKTRKSSSKNRLLSSSSGEKDHGIGKEKSSEEKKGRSESKKSRRLRHSRKEEHKEKLKMTSAKHVNENQDLKGEGGEKHHRSGTGNNRLSASINYRRREVGENRELKKEGDDDEDQEQESEEEKNDSEEKEKDKDPVDDLQSVAIPSGKGEGLVEDKSKEEGTKEQDLEDADKLGDDGEKDGENEDEGNKNLKSGEKSGGRADDSTSRSQEKELDGRKRKEKDQGTVKKANISIQFRNRKSMPGSPSLQQFEIKKYLLVGSIYICRRQGRRGSWK